MIMDTQFRTAQTPVLFLPDGGLITGRFMAIAGILLKNRCLAVAGQVEQHGSELRPAQGQSGSPIQRAGKWGWFTDAMVDLTVVTPTENRAKPEPYRRRSCEFPTLLPSGLPAQSPLLDEFSAQMRGNEGRISLPIACRATVI